MTLLLATLISIAGNIVGSLIALAIWFHFDLEGYWDQHRHDRIVRNGKRLDEKAMKAHEGALKDFYDEDAARHGYYER